MIKALFRLFIIKPWQGYISWCDDMGLTLENKRSCMPMLSEPEATVATLSSDPNDDNIDKKEPDYD